jgi:hypothetical protein
MAPISSPYSKSYNSFSGVDIKGVFGSEVMGELQAISYSITREKAPVYTMGSPDPRSFSRGKRGIAGTLIFVMFDEHAILNALGGYRADGGLLFQSDIDDIRPAFEAPGTGSFAANLSAVGSAVTAADTVQNQETNITSVSQDQVLASAWYADQIPPFDITLAAANEYGALAVMRIFGVELLNEGYGVSVDDIVSEYQHTYVARSVIGWTMVPSANAEAIASQGGVSTGA